MRPLRFVFELLDLALIAAGFLAAEFVYRTFFPINFDFLTSEEVLLGLVTSILAFWVAFKLLEASGSVRFIDILLVASGTDLLIQVLLNYFQFLTRSLFLIVAGVVCAAILMQIARRLLPRPVTNKGILLVGFDPVTYRLARTLNEPILGIVEDPGASPSEIERLGVDLEEIAHRCRPARIVVSDTWVARIPPTWLLNQRLQGVVISTEPGLIETQMRKIYCRDSEPVDLLLSPSLSLTSRTLAIHSVYTNLVGLALLILLFPLLMILCLAIALFSGPGPVFETTECSGFRDIPFLLMRFRTRNALGASNWVGGLIERCRLTHLPQLLNIVRGEMALFGPRPVRRVFARRLSELLPFYPMRFSVKPGLIGWAPASFSALNELTQIEYDLYYVKWTSLQLDLEILARTLFGQRRSAVSIETSETV